MNIREDDDLHALIRTKIDEYKPDYQTSDWEAIRPKLIRKQRPNRVFIFAFCLIFSGILSWLIYSKKGIETTTRRVLIEKTPPIESDKNDTQKHIIEDVRRIAGLTKRQMTSKHKFAFIQNNNNDKGIAVFQSSENTIPVENHILVEDIKLLSQTQSLAGLHTQDPTIDLEGLKVEMEIRRQLYTGAFGTDSTAYKVFDRNISHWKNTVVVCDFTSSMYPYSTQLYAWFKNNQNNTNVKAMVFFTDCDSVGHEIQKSRAAGKMFVAIDKSVEALLPIMLAAARNTRKNSDDPENNVEALLFAQKQFPDAEHLVLIADNSSAVRGMNGLYKVKKPVHVLLCGSTEDTTLAIQPHHLRIASRTKGSLHTLEDDIFAPNYIKKNTWIRVDNRYYKYKKGTFVVSDFKKRPRQFLGLFWF